MQSNVIVKDVPEDYYGECSSNCGGIFRIGRAYPISPSKSSKTMKRALSSVKGERVLMGFAALASQFNEFAPEAQKVIDSVQWRGS